MVKSTSYSCKRLRFNSQHPHGNSQLPITTVLRDLTLFVVTRNSFIQVNTHTHKINLFGKFKEGWGGTLA